MRTAPLVSGPAGSIEAHLSDARQRAVRVLMGLAAASALAALATAIRTVTEASASAQMAETWRMYGFLAFAAVFALLGWRPLHYRWLWEIAILNKLLLTVTAGGYAIEVIGPGDVDGAMAAFISDGVLTAALVTAYIVCRGWRAASKGRRDPGDGG